MNLPIYLDYASTTPVDNRVVKKMFNYLSIDGIFGNSSSSHHYFGNKAAEEVDIARNKIANLIGCSSLEIIFTSGATESNNLVIKGVYDFFNKKKHIITTRIEHKSIIETCHYLEKYRKCRLTYLKPKKNGLISLKDIENSIDNDTILISIMYVNNEIGSIQNIFAISELCQKYKILFHVDGTQAVGKIPIFLKTLKIDFLSFSAHKIYGPKGIGVLFARQYSKKFLRKQIHGGNHEFNIRAGTLPIHQIIGMGKACELAQKEMKMEMNRIRKLRDIFWDKIKKIDFINLNGDINYMLPNIMNINLKNLKQKNMFLIFKNLAVSTSSACNSQSLIPSYVLTSLGLSQKEAKKSIRFSIGRFTTKKEIIFAANFLKNNF